MILVHMKTNTIVIPELNNAYRSPFSLTILSQNALLDGMNIKGFIKVDTGCSFTAIALGGFLSPKEAKRCKQHDIELFRKGIIEARRSFGVHDRDKKKQLKNIGKYYLEDCTDEELLNDKMISFVHSTKTFCLNKTRIGDLEYKVSYDRKDPSLLGVNYLKNVKGELLIIDNRSYLVLNESLDDSIYAKVYNLLKKKLIIRDVIEILKREGYNQDNINSAIIDTVSNTYVTEDVFEEKEV